MIAAEAPRQAGDWVSNTSQAAFTFLARTSSHSNIKLRDIAERVIADHSEKLRRE